MYYSIYCKMMLDFCRMISETLSGFNATLSSVLYTETHNLEFNDILTLKQNNETREKTDQDRWFNNIRGRG